MSSEIIVTEEGRVSLIVEPELSLQVIVEDVPDIDLILLPVEEIEVLVVHDTGPQGPPGEGGGGGADEVWINANEPADPAIELWIDTDETVAIAQRSIVTWTTANLAVDVSETGTIMLAPGYRLYQMGVDRPSRVRLYTTVAKRDSDLARPIGTDPPENCGCIFEYVAQTAITADLSPMVDGFDGKGSPDGLIPIAVTNLDIAAGTVSTTLTYVRTE